jgi:hypothetical protein
LALEKPLGCPEILASEQETITWLVTNKRRKPNNHGHKYAAFMTIIAEL